MKYGCDNASAADIRSAGSNFRRRSRRSIAIQKSTMWAASDCIIAYLAGMLSEGPVKKAS